MKHTILLICLTFQMANSQTTTLFSDMEGEALALAVQEEYAPSIVLNYQHARDTLYSLIDIDQDSVRCIYSGAAKYLAEGEDPSKYLFGEGKPTDINCEHAWPRSKGTKTGHAFSDMHHLFPTQVGINQARGNRPYGEVHDHRTQKWYYLNEITETLPDEKTIDLYSEAGDGRFEPREAVKGDIARAIFYVFYIYPETVDGLFISTQMSTLLYWHDNDPPDDREISRTWAIARYQDDKPNPFIIDPSLIHRILQLGD